MLKIMISPAKKMRIDDDFPAEVSLPLLLEKTEQIKEYLQSLEPEELKEIWKCNDRLVQENTQRLKQMNLQNRLTPAVIAYEGIQYQTMAPGVMEQNSLAYLKEHLYILSGFYGILRAFDGVVPYRLEMQAKMKWQWKTLYEYWGDSLYRILAKPGGYGHKSGIQRIQQGYRTLADGGCEHDYLCLWRAGGENSGQKNAGSKGKSHCCQDGQRRYGPVSG